MKCIICGCSVKEDKNYYFCDCCGVVYKSKDLILNNSEEKKRYEYHNNSIDDIKYVNYFKKFIDNSVIPYINGKEGLDYGCGKNCVLEQILERDYQLEVDSYDKYFLNDVKLQSRYDFIVCTEVIEHIDNPLDFLNILDNFLTPGKTISIMTQLLDNVNDFFSWWYIRDETHICFFSVKTFKFIARKMNYDIVYTNNIDAIVLRKR